MSYQDQDPDQDLKSGLKSRSGYLIRIMSKIGTSNQDQNQDLEQVLE